MTTPYMTQPATPNFPITDSESDEIRPHTLPPPQTFDFLPPLHGILARLLVPSPNSSISQLGALPDGTNAGHHTGSETASIKGDSDKFLDIQHLGAASAGIKVRIQKARQAIKDLPDIDRTIEEQEQEIRELEQRIEEMKDVLTRVGNTNQTTKTEEIGDADMET